MTGKTFLMVGALTLSTLGIASAKSYDIVLAQPAMALLTLLPSRLSVNEDATRGHTRGTETEGLEEKLDDETSVSAGFSGIKNRDLLLLGDKPVFLDPQLLDFRVQRRAGNSEFRCRTFWACNFPFTFRKSRFNNFSLLLLESVWQTTC